MFQECQGHSGNQVGKSVMHARTAATLDKLRGETWFRNVGLQDTEAAEVLSSWDEAIRSCSSPEWIGLCHDAVDAYCARIQARSPSDYKNWNQIVLSIRPNVISLVREMTETVIQQNGLPRVFLDSVGWDILHACMESELADIFPPGFYASQAYWYMKGHFPCGWKGPFPEGGTLLIY
jgi:hypothetical protein